MLTEAQIAQFRTCGFVVCRGLLSTGEMEALSEGFDAAMSLARGGASLPSLEEERQHAIPFFDYGPEALSPLLDDERIVGALQDLMGEHFILILTEGLVHTGGTHWHHDLGPYDDRVPDGFVSGRAAIYLDPLGPEYGCLSVIPGSHFREYRHALVEAMGEMGLPGGDVPGRHRLVNEPGDVIFMNHKTFHGAFGPKRHRRALHINCAQNATPETNQEHFDYLLEFLSTETNRWGRF